MIWGCALTVLRTVRERDYRVHGPGQLLDRIPVSPPPCTLPFGFAALCAASCKIVPDNFVKPSPSFA